MQCGSAELAEQIAELRVSKPLMGAGAIGGHGAMAAVAKEDAGHVVVVDGMYDAAPLAAEVCSPPRTAPTKVHRQCSEHGVRR